MEILKRFLDPAVVWVTIPVAAILVFGTLAIVKSVIRHRERMATIGMGIDPDAHPVSDVTHSERLNHTSSPL